MTDTTTMEAHVEALIKKAAEANAASDALHFSQAAANSANALCALRESKRPL